VRPDAFTFLTLLIVCGVTWSCLFAFWWAPTYKRRLLGLLAEGRGLAMHGLELGERARVPRFCVYMLLAELEDEGLARSWDVPGGIQRGFLPKRMYSATPKGRGEAQ
jgi:DNA-binding PadR family transcriptional regulator